MDPIDELNGLGSPAAIQAWLVANVETLSPEDFLRVQRWVADNVSPGLPEVGGPVGQIRQTVQREADNRNLPSYESQPESETATGAASPDRRQVAPSESEDPLGYYRYLLRTNPQRFISELTNNFTSIVRSNPRGARDLGFWVEETLSPGLGNRNILRGTEGPLNLFGPRLRFGELSIEQNDRLARWWESGAGQLHAEVARVVDSAPEETTDETLVGGLDPSLTAFLFESQDNPEWLMDITGRPLTDDQKDRILRVFNTFYVSNPNAGGEYRSRTVGSWEQLMPILEQMQGTEQLLSIISAGVGDVVPETGFSVRFADGQRAFVDNGTLDFLSQFGLDEQDTAVLLRQVSQSMSNSSLVRPGGTISPEVAVTFLPVYVASMNLNGLLEPFLGERDLPGPVVDSTTVRGQRQQREQASNRFRSPFLLDAGEREPLLTDETAMPFEQPRSTSNRAEASRLGLSAARGDQSFDDNEFRRMVRAGGRDQVSRNQRLTGPRWQRAIEEGLRLYYDNPGMALIYSSGTAGPALAARVLGNTLRGEQYSRADRMELIRIANGSNLMRAESRQTVADRFAAVLGPSAAATLGVFAVAEERANELERLRSRRPSGGGGGGGGSMRMMPDRTAITQAVTDLYKQFFMQDPSPEEVDDLADTLIRRIMSTPTSQQVDANAQLRAILSESPLYNQFYGRLPDGFTEEELQQQALQGQATILGNDFQSKRAAQAGLMDGRYQSAVGAAAASREAFDNSTFMGRLAQARQVLEQMT